MANNTQKSVDKNVVKNLANKKNYYSWLKDGEGSTNYLISDNLSSLLFDVGSNTASDAAVNITLDEGNTSSKVKIIAAGYAYSGQHKDESDYSSTFYAPDSVTIKGVDATAIYGGTFITKKSYYNRKLNWTYTGAVNSKYEGTDAIIDGSVNLAIDTVKVSNVYGGGAGFGSTVTGDVNITVRGTNTISNVYGGGQKGADVNGNVSIEVFRGDLKSGRISNIYGGGTDAGTVYGDVTITIHGTNAAGIGTVSGSGKGNKAKVQGDRYLVIDGFAGKFATTIKDFDRITLTSGTAITLTQSQQKSIQSAQYQFIIDDRTLTQKDAMLTWNKNIDVGRFYITVADEFASNADDAFVTTIYSSTYLTQAAFDKAGMKVYDEAGKEITSGYSLEFVADLDNKGNAKKKGGSIVLKFDGTNADVTGDDTTNREFTAADDDVNIRGKYVSASVDAKGGNNKITLQKDSVMAGNVNADGGNDRFTVQSGAIMSGTLALGAGENEIDILGGGEINGAIKLANGTAEKRVKNTIDVNGSISQIEGGNEFTDNTIWIKNEKAVGYWEYDTLLGVRGGLDIALQGDVLSGEISLGEKRANFVDQDLDLTHSNGSNDTVYVTQASKWDGNINFGKGKDMLVLNTPAEDPVAASHGTITKEGDDLVIVANQTGVTVNANKMKLAGTDTILVVSNGVRANVNGIAIGALESNYKGIFLGQNAHLDLNAADCIIQSFDGDLFLDRNLTILKAPEYNEELAARIGAYYTVGTGVNADIEANGNTITIREGASVNGTVIGAGKLYFKGTAGGDILFETDQGEDMQIEVAKNAIATVGSINGIAGTTFRGADDFENDSAKVTLNEDAALYAAQDENLLVGNVTKETDFAAKYGDMAKGKISVIDAVKAKVTFTDGNIYFGKKAAFKKGITFVGDNTVDVQSQKIVLDHTQLDVTNGKVAFNVLDGAELVFDGIVKGGDYDKDKIQVNLGENARFAYGENMETASWDKEFDNDKRDGRTNITFRADSQIRNKINLDAAGDDLTVNLEDGVQVKGKLGKLAEDAAVVTLGQGEDTLNAKKATVDGVIEAANDGGVKDVINLAGSTVNGMKAPKAETAILLDNADQVFMTDKAKVNGDIVGGGLVHITDSEVTGSIEATKNVLVGATVATIKNGDTFVESGKDASGTESKIGLVDATANDVAVFADDAKATISAFEGTTGNTIHLEARNKGTVALSNVDTTVGDVEFRAFHDGSAVDFGGDVKLVADNATFTAEEGGELKNLGNVQVDGGFTGDIKTLAGTTAAAQTATLASVNGKAITAGDVTFVADDSAINLASEGTFNTLGAIAQSGALTKDGYGRVTGAAAANTAAVTLGEKTFLSAKSVDQVAADADVGVGGNGGLTVEGDITQQKFATAGIWAGGVADDGTPLDGALSVGGNIVQESEEDGAVAVVGTMGTLEVKGADGIVQTAKGRAVVAGFGENTVAGGIAQNTDDATVALVGESKVGGIVAQVANTAKVTVEGDATVAGGIVQKNVDATGKDIAAATAEVNVAGTLAGDVTQLAGAALVKFDNEAEIASVGAVTQSGGATARVMGKADVTQAYTTETFFEALEDKNIDAIERTVGAVSQEADENAVKLDATVFADGEYDGANNHKAAKINIGSVTLKAGDIEQVGDKNVVTANVAYTAQGESDVTIGATAIELGTITQTSDEGNRNVVEITAAQTMGAENQSVMTLGDITGKVGAISQKAYKAINKVDLDVATAEDDNLTVGNAKLDVEGGISMLAYGDGAKNNLNLAGSVNVAGDVKVGGVIDGENISEDSVWGDRTAERNLVNVTADTVKIDGNLSLVGLTNKLTLENESYFKGDTETKNPVAKDIALAGKKNAVDIAAGVKVDNISLYDLIDHDGIGVEGYDLTTDGNYTNEITLRGEAAGLVLNKQLRANDTINVFGGKIEGGLVTGNGEDAINLGNDGKLLEGADGTMAARVMGDATIGGDVKMGDPDAENGADGSNAITMQAFAARDLANPDEDVAHNVAIGGKVDMYAGKNSKTNAAAANTLSLAGTGVFNADTGLTTVGTASIGGAVTMVAENAYDANGDVLDEGTNTINMGPLSTIGGAVTMTAYSQNKINVRASEEIVKEAVGADVDAYAVIDGAVEMKAKANEIEVLGAGPLAPDVQPYGAAAYMDGITMSNLYTDQDGKDYIIQEAAKTTVNTITVGDRDNMVGSELIVGKSVAETNDVTMGTIEVVKQDGVGRWSWDLATVAKDAKGHDVLTYLGEQQVEVKDLTDENRITVSGRFDARDVLMMAKDNYIDVKGNGLLGKGDPTLASEEVRTASFTANTVTQIAGLNTENSIVAEGTASLLHYGYALLDPVTGEYDDNLSGIAELPSVRFTTGDISQLQYGTVEGGLTAADNTVSLTGFIIAKTGAITQQGEGTNYVEVKGYETRSLDPNQTLADMGLAVERSTVGAIAQGSEALLGNDNIVDLTRTDAGTISQFAANDNTVTMTSSTSGAITETAGDDNYVKLTDSTSGAITQDAVNSNTVWIDPSTVDGAITQTSAEGWNLVKGEGTMTPPDGVGAPIIEKSYVKGDIKQVTTGTSNEVDAYLTDIDGAISQDGVTLNKVSVRGDMANVTFAHDDETKPFGTYQEQVSVKVGGDITQTNAAVNTVELEEVDFGNTVSQTAQSMNIFAASATETDDVENIGVSPDDPNCEYEGNSHASSSVVESANFNTKSVGTVTQTVAITAEDIPEGGAMIIPPFGNSVAADNVDLGDITQAHNFSSNSIAVNQTFDGKVMEMAKYPGEIDNSLAEVNYVEGFEKNTTTKVGAISQTGTANAATLNGVEGSTVTQAAVAPEFVEGVAGGNDLTVTAVADVKAVVVEKATWDPNKGGFDKEVFTKAILDGSANVRKSSTLGAITQTTAAKGNFEAANQVENNIDLTNTTVDGDVSQTAVNANANLKNSFTATTTAESFVDLGKDATDAIVEVNYDRTTKDSVKGALTQTGYENTAAVTNVDVTGNVTQTTELIDTTGHHGDQFTGTAIGGNLLVANGSKDAAVAEKDLVAAGVAKLDEQLNIVDVAVGGKIVQTVNNKDGKTEDADGNKFIDKLTKGNTFNAYLANMGDVEQTTTYGKNVVDIDSDNLADKPQTQLTAGTITQKGTANDLYADTTKMGAVKQDAVATEALPKGAKNSVVLTGSVEPVHTEGAGTLADPHVIVLQPDRAFAEAASITQTTKQIADKTLVDGKDLYDEANNGMADENIVIATYANVGDITQGGEGMIDNTVSFNGYLKKVYAVDPADGQAKPDETQTVKENTLGKVTQGGVYNFAEIYTAKSVDDIAQTADSVDTVATTATSPVLKQTVSKVPAITNYLAIDDADKVGKIDQIATSDKYTTEYYEDGELVSSDPEAAVTASNESNLTKVVTGDVTQTIDGEAGLGGNGLTVDQSTLGVVAQTTKIGNNTIAASASDIGNVGQTTKVGDNGITAAGTDFDDVTQTTDQGNNTLTSNTYTDGAAHEAQSKEIGKIIQTGTTNAVTTQDVETKAITQTANGVEADDTLSNSVNMTGKALDAIATLKDGEIETLAASYDFTQADIAKAKAESITQEVKAVAEQDDMFDATMAATNAVTLAIADAGDISQTGNANTTNTVNFTGATVVARKLNADDAGIMIDPAIPLVDDPDVPAAYPNVIGAVTQQGQINTATIQDGTSAGNIAQTALSNKTIATVTDDKGDEDPLNDEKTVTESQNDISNNLTLSNIATAGTVNQAATSDKFTQRVSEYVKDADGEWALKEVVLPLTNPTESDGYVNASNTANLTKVNTGDVTQTIDGTAGLGGNGLVVNQSTLGAVTQTTSVGNNTVTASASTLGATTQTTKVGDNVLSATTYTTVTEEQSTKIGTVGQTGLTNAVTTGDVHTGAITQNANGVEKDDALSNSVAMTGVIISASEATLKEGAEDATLPESWEIVSNAHVADTKADSIKQVVAAKEFWDTGAVEVDEALTAPAALTNTVTLNTADAGWISQTGNARTENTVTFTGAEVTLKKVDSVDTTDPENPIPVVVDGDKVYPNTFGEIKQSGVLNTVNLTNGTFAAAEGAETTYAIEQETKTFDMVFDDPDAVDGLGFPAPKYFKTKYQASLDNNATLSNVTMAGDVKQTVNSVSFQESKQIGNAAAVLTDIDVNGNNTFAATTATVGKIEQIGGALNKVELDPAGGAAGAVKAGAIEQTAAIAGKTGILANEVYVFDGSEAASIKQTANGEKDATAAIDTYGRNSVRIAEADVIGLIDQTAAGSAAYNDVTATALYAKVESVDPAVNQAAKLAEDPTWTPSEEDPDVFTNGKFRSIGDVTQTLNSTAENLAAGAVNTISLQNVDAGVLTQTATGYATNKIVTPLAASPYNANLALNQWEILDPTTGVATPAAALKPTIDKIDQKGLANEVNLMDVSVAGDISQLVTKIDDDTIALESSNTLTLEKVDVGGKISSTTEVIPTTIGDKTISIAGAGSTLNLTDVTVKGGIETGDGVDTLNLNGATTVEGVIDLGDVNYTVTELPTDPVSWLIAANGVDTLNVNSADVDLSAAEIKGVEMFKINDATVQSITVKSIDASTIYFEYGQGAYPAAYETNIYAESVTLGTLDGVHYLNALDAKTDITVALNDGGYGIGVRGASAFKDDDDNDLVDTLTIGDGEGVDLFENSWGSDLEQVTFTKGATGATNNNWIETTGDADAKIAFTFDAEATTFDIGTFSGYNAEQVTFNDFEVAAGFEGAIVDGTKWVKDGQTYTWSAGTLTLA